MSKVLMLLFISISSCSNVEQKSLALKIQTKQKIAHDSCIDYNSLNSKIRDGQKNQDSALAEIQELIPLIKSKYYQNGGMDYKEINWTFPIEGYTSKAIGGTNGSGYIANGYNYFEGNKHKGHPAHDIFIHDINQDCFDDNTQKPVNVLSMTGGIVIATENNWDTQSELRGGKYIWIYDPYSNSFFYYAHNNSVSVKPCDIVTPGMVIATVGRTGLNAFKKRSPTHLHIMQLKLDKNFFPKPVNCYQSLIKIKSKT